MTIGQRIKLKREEKGYTQEYVAKIVGCAIQTIYKYENEIVTNIPLDKLEKIANALNVTPAYLMGWEDETNSIEEEQKETEILISLSNSLIVDKINILKNAKGLNNSTLAQLAGIPNSTLTEILKGRTAKIPIQSLISIAKVLDCTVEYLYNDNISDRYYGEKHIIDQYEFNHIEKYRALDEYGKKAVDSILNLEYERATNKEEQSNKVKEFPKTEINDKEIVSTAQSAAFGDGTELITYTKEEEEELSKLHDRLDEIFKK